MFVTYELVQSDEKLAPLVAELVQSTVWSRLWFLLDSIHCLLLLLVLIDRLHFFVVTAVLDGYLAWNRHRRIGLSIFLPIRPITFFDSQTVFVDIKVSRCSLFKFFKMVCDIPVLVWSIAQSISILLGDRNVARVYYNLFSSIANALEGILSVDRFHHTHFYDLNY